MLGAGEEVVDKAAHFFFGKSGTRFDGVLSRERPDQFFAFGEAHLADKILVLLEQLLDSAFLIALAGVAGCSLDDKAVFSKRLDGVPKLKQIGDKLGEENGIG